MYVCICDAVIADAGLDICIHNDLGNKVCQIRIEEGVRDLLLAPSLDESEVFGLRYNFQLFDNASRFTYTYIDVC